MENLRFPVKRELIHAIIYILDQRGVENFAYAISHYSKCLKFK